ncbi:hypothetical protein OS493_011375 [Desmophyllum pertusum]|uniref:Uncharacterized protein n=1 Tax=Desmophyllum pertusum TaxID=174260 RepID=A0A9X0CSE3_9CNID|nr:hypothetical protein OS493_011375 [Desmophyllum pertusum]
MALRSIPFNFRRRLFPRRCFTVAVVVAILPFIGYFMLFAASSEKLRQTSSTNIDDCCEACRNAAKQQNGADNSSTDSSTDSSTAKTLIDEHDFSKLAGHSNGLLNIHMWSEICGAELAILRNWPHFPYFPNTRSFISEFHRTQGPASSNNGEKDFWIYPSTEKRRVLLCHLIR